MPLTVTHELTISPECAYVLAYGEYNDGTDYADVVTAKALAIWGDELRHMSVSGDADEGYHPIYTCGFCGDEHEGPTYQAVVLK